MYTDDERNMLYDLRFEACNNDETCVHSDNPYSMTGTDTHYRTCPRHEEYECPDSSTQETRTEEAEVDGRPTVTINTSPSEAAEAAEAAS